jgi:NAD(P)-dependent dehydrogenase (short-subunit alcohol dehydrogenase family)
LADCIVITGASSGIGNAAAKALSEQGYDVVNLDRKDHCSEDFDTIKCDLSDKKELCDVLEEVRTKRDVVGLINNAGFARTAPLEDTETQLLSDTFDINLTSAAICARELLPTMKRRGFGRIVNIASRAALGRELRTAYAASKGGLIAMTRVWALELGSLGITANCVAPGPIVTELFDEMNPNGSDRRKKMVGEIPVGRMGTPEDVAHAVKFFIDPQSGFINGQCLYVCGGLSTGIAPL